MVAGQRLSASCRFQGAAISGRSHPSSTVCPLQAPAGRQSDREGLEESAILSRHRRHSACQLVSQVNGDRRKEGST